MLRGFALAMIVAGLGKALLEGGRLAGFCDTLRAFNRRLFNPLILQFAGKSPWPVSRLEHRGRRSHAHRATPVLAWPIDGGFLVPMPYGADVDWARNLLHDGQGVLQHRGVRYRIGNPRFVAPAEARAELPGEIGQIVALSPLRHVMRIDVMPSLTAEVTLPA